MKPWKNNILVDCPSVDLASPVSWLWNTLAASA